MGDDLLEYLGRWPRWRVCGKKIRERTSRLQMIEAGNTMPLVIHSPSARLVSPY